MKTQEASVEFTIKQVTKESRDEWLRMRHALWPGESEEDFALEVDAYFRVAAPTMVTLVAARPEGGLCGFVEVDTRSYAEGCAPGPVPFIEGWYVDADVRRRGLGRALLRAAEEWALARGHSEIGSDVELGNEGSIAAHLAAGYEEVERVVCFRRTLNARR